MRRVTFSVDALDAERVEDMGGDLLICEQIESVASQDHAGSVEELVLVDWCSGVYASGASVAFDESEVLDVLCGYAGSFPSVRSIRVGDLHAEESVGEECWLGDLSGLFWSFPDMESFFVCGRSATFLDHISHGALRALELVLRDATGVVTSVRRASFPRLESLSWTLDTDPAGLDHLDAIDEDRFVAWLRRLPALRSLTLRGALVSDRLVRKLIVSGLLERLDTLSLAPFKELHAETLDALRTCRQTSTSLWRSEVRVAA